MLTTVSILMLALFCSGCATSRKVSQTTTTNEVRAFEDSLKHEVRIVETVTVPQSEVKIEIPIDSLRKLPEKAEYRAKSGQANAVVKFKRDTVIVYAICDSLQRQCEYYESVAANYKEAYESLHNILQEEKEQRMNPVRIAFISLLAGIVVGVLLTIIVKLKIKRI
ncbi:MAG: hypothetical protein IJP08_03815 [Bacteroidaceae bacterium]|nr:hypothetical protein [Bacteroidaceae bacterium]